MSDSAIVHKLGGYLWPPGIPALSQALSFTLRLGFLKQNSTRLHALNALPLACEC